MTEIDRHDRFRGAMLGLALGDAFGAPYEGGPIERIVWAIVGKTREGKRRWTDDTSMSLDLARSLCERAGLDLDDLATRFAKSYRWSRGYGPAAAKTLKAIEKGMSWQQANRLRYKDGSMGNGGAMRAPVIGLYFARDLDQLADAARQSASVTHAHPLGMDAAVMIAIATAKALGGAKPDEILEASNEDRLPALAEKLARFTKQQAPTKELDPKMLRRDIGVGMLADESPVAADRIRERERHLVLDLGGIACEEECGERCDRASALQGARRLLVLRRQPSESVDGLELHGHVRRVKELDEQGHGVCLEEGADGGLVAAHVSDGHRCLALRLRQRRRQMRDERHVPTGLEESVGGARVALQQVTERREAHLLHGLLLAEEELADVREGAARNERRHRTRHERSVRDRRDGTLLDVLEV